MHCCMSVAGYSKLLTVPKSCTAVLIMIYKRELFWNIYRTIEAV